LVCWNESKVKAAVESVWGKSSDNGG